MVLLGVADEAELKAWEDRLTSEGIGFETFVEPDIGDQKTALAVYPTEDTRMFRRLQLLK